MTNKKLAMLMLAVSIVAPKRILASQTITGVGHYYCSQEDPDCERPQIEEIIKVRADAHAFKACANEIPKRISDYKIFISPTWIGYHGTARAEYECADPLLPFPVPLIITP
jgi:hypothetical protein